MSKPAGKCAFCREPGNLTKGHIWAEWVGESIEFDDTQHVQLLGHSYTFEPKARMPSFQRLVKQGHGTSRKPRNTCATCNGGWMSKIENAAKPIALPLMLGQPLILGVVEQTLLSAFLCLTVMRNEFSKLAAVAIPDGDRDWLRANLVPPWHNWRVWVTRYLGTRPKEHWIYHYPMHIDSTPVGDTGPHMTNTQTTTLVIGQLCAHIFSSTIMGEELPGYEGIHLCQIWPPSQYPIDWRYVPAYGEPALLALAEALGKDIPAGDN